MNTKSNWDKLLLVAGVQFTKYRFIEGDKYCIAPNNKEYLEKLLSNCGLHEESIGVNLLKEPPSKELWLEAMKKSFGGNGESGSYGGLSPTSIEFPMQALVINLNRLGLETFSACGGHGKNARPVFRRMPHLVFRLPTDAQITKNLLTSSGYKCHLGQYGELCIDESVDRLLDAGSMLGLLQDVEDWKHHLYTQRESLLLHLLNIPGVSGNEIEIGETMRTFLSTRLDSVQIDESGNVLGYKDSSLNGKKSTFTILLSAHLDVLDDSGDGFPIIRNGNVLEREKGILGADDRAGLAMVINCLDMLENSDIPVNIKIALPTQEETGQKGASKINLAFFDDIDFAISLDRHGNGDIVYKSNCRLYCDEQKARLFEIFSRELWGQRTNVYQLCEGRTSDLRVWSSYGIPSVNLSIGFKDEHFSSETLDLEAWHRTHDLLIHSIYELEYKLSQLQK